MSVTWSRTVGPTARPVAVPEDIDDPSLKKAAGCVELPLHVRWSDPAMVYDLSTHADMLRVYEQVLREGTEDDVRYYIDVRHLRTVFDALILPPRVREAWGAWLDRHRDMQNRPEC